MKKLLQINPVVRISTSTGRIMQEIGELAMQNGWESYIAYGFGRDGHKPCSSQLIPVGNTWDVRWHGVMTRLFDRHGLASRRATLQFVEQIKQIDPDIIHIHNIHGYFLNYQILFDYLSSCGKPIIWTVHDCWLYTGHCYHYAYAGCYKWENHCKNCPQKRAFPTSYWHDRSSKNFIDKRNAFTSIPKDLVRFTTVSAWMRKEMSRSFLKEYDFQVIHNGIDTSVFKPRSVEAVKQKYGLTDKRHILLGVASIWSDEKGLSDFLSLSERMSEEEVIVLVGVDESLKNRLPKKIKAISRTENIEQLSELYSAATAFVNPTWQDNYPTVNMESIACGTPVVTYRTGGSIETITPDTGHIVEQGDIDGLLHAVRDIEELGKEYFTPRCRDYALAHFRKEERYADYLRLYENFIANK